MGSAAAFFVHTAVSLSLIAEMNIRTAFGIPIVQYTHYNCTHSGMLHFLSLQNFMLLKSRRSPRTLTDLYTKTFAGNDQSGNTVLLCYWNLLFTTILIGGWYHFVLFAEINP